MGTETSEIAVVGAGAIGLYLASQIQTYHGQTVLISRNAQTATKVNDEGIFCQIEHTVQQTEVPSTVQTKGLGAQSLIVLAVKTYGVQEALHRIKDLVGPDTVILTLQNGLGTVEMVQEFFPETIIMAGSMVVGAERTGINTVKIYGRPEVTIGLLAQKDQQTLEWLGHLFRDIGFTAHITMHTYEVLWRKLVINTAINPVALLSGKTNGALLNSVDAQRLIRSLAQETIRVAQALGFLQGEDGYVEKITQVLQETAGNKASMLQDFLAGQPTEIDAISGQVVLLGQRLKIPTPYNETMLYLIRLLENKTHGMPQIH